MTVLSLLPFPPLLWWHKAQQAAVCRLDAGEPFRKMGARNRYRLASSNGSLWLTVPIVGGREQRTPVGEIAIDNRLPWQRNHWRSIGSIYRRTPFFEHYEPSLQRLFTEPWTSLAAFNEATIEWCRKALGLEATFETALVLPPTFEDFREGRLDFTQFPQAPYAQPFASRVGFQRGMSILDLLFCEGPATAAVLE